MKVLLSCLLSSYIVAMDISIQTSLKKNFESDIEKLPPELVRNIEHFSAPPYKWYYGDYILKHKNHIQAVEYNKKGDCIVTRSNKHIEIWNANTGEQKHSFKHNNYVTSAEVHPHKNVLLTAVYDESASIWDIDTGEKTQSFIHESGLYNPQWHPTHDLVLAIAPDENIIQIWDINAPTEKKLLPRDDDFIFATWHPVNNSVIMQLEDHTIITRDINTGEKIICFNTEGFLIGVMHRNGGNEALIKIPGETFNILQIVTIEGAEIHTFSSNSPIDAVIPHPTKNILGIVSTESNSVDVLYIDDKKNRTLMHDKVKYIIWHPIESFLTTLSDDVTKIWNYETGEQLQHLQHYTRENIFTWHPQIDSFLIASDNEVRIYRSYTKYTLEQLRLKYAFLAWILIEKPDRRIYPCEKKYSWKKIFSDIIEKCGLDGQESFVVWNSFSKGMQKALRKTLFRRIQEYGKNGVRSLSYTLLE